MALMVCCADRDLIPAICGQWSGSRRGAEFAPYLAGAGSRAECFVIRSAGRRNAGRPKKIKSATFELSAPNLAACPRLPLPEFALIGRSNVGKSSLINLPAEKRDLAKVSDLPGKTRLMNFFTFNATWRLVDLPGYGYAHVSKQERADFNEATADFLTRRETLLHTSVLIDSRLPPQRIDVDFLAWMRDEEVPHSLVFTKVDKQSKSATQGAIDRYRATVLRDQVPEPAIFMTSSKTKDGRKELLGHIAEQITD